MSNPSWSRMRRVNSVVQQVIAEEVEELKDPRLGFVSITGVDTAPNLRSATVYFSPLEAENAEETRKALESAAPRLRRILGEQVRLKYTPALRFQLDTAILAGERMEQLLREIAQEPDDGEDSESE